MAAGTGVLPGVLCPAGVRQGQTQAPVEAGSAFAGVRTRCGLGRGGLSRRRGVRGQLEGRGGGRDAAAVEEQEDEKQGACEAPCDLCGTAAGKCWHTTRTHPHPDALASSLSLCLCVCLCVFLCPQSSRRCCSSCPGSAATERGVCVSEGGEREDGLMWRLSCTPADWGTVWRLEERRQKGRGHSDDNS